MSRPIGVLISASARARASVPAGARRRYAGEECGIPAIQVGIQVLQEKERCPSSLAKAAIAKSDIPGFDDLGDCRLARLLSHESIYWLSYWWGGSASPRGISPFFSA